MHVSAVIPNFRITEYFVNFERSAATSRVTPTVKDGWIDLPTAPGLGIDIDVDKLRAHPHQEASKHGFRQYWEEYPRKGYEPPWLSETRIAVRLSPGCKGYRSEAHHIGSSHWPKAASHRGAALNDQSYGGGSIMPKLAGK